MIRDYSDTFDLQEKRHELESKIEECQNTKKNIEYKYRELLRDIVRGNSDHKKRVETSAGAE